MAGHPPPADAPAAGIFDHDLLAAVRVA